MKNMKFKPAILSFALTPFMLMACEKSGLLEARLNTESYVSGLSSTRDMNQFPLHKVVCDPWSGGGGMTKPEQGIRARMAYRGAGQKAWSNSVDYLNHGQVSSQLLFFTDLSVPTRMFDQGFSTQTSQVVKDDAGEKLIEYFGLEFATDLRLDPTQSATSYEFALLADDGVTLEIGEGSQAQTLIKDEGDHPTRMSCGEFSVPMEHSRTLPIKLNYFQGPRYHIALTLMWRPTSAGLAKSDPLCGHSGNDLYFDPDTSAPKKSYKDLEARGWRPVPAGNFYLPGQQIFNPCIEGEKLEISGFKVLEISSYQADVAWNSTRPATSQVLFKKISTGEETLTPSDNMLRTDHSLLVTGLEPDETYEIQAVSVAEDGSKAFGPKTILKTP